MARQNPQGEHWSTWIPYIGLVVALVSTIVNPALLLSILALVLGIVGLIVSLRQPKGSRALGIIVSIAAVMVALTVTFVGLRLEF